jgi:hypothetical protein
MSIVKDDRAPPTPAEHKRRAQTRWSAPNDDDVKEITAHSPAHRFNISA